MSTEGKRPTPESISVTAGLAAGRSYRVDFGVIHPDDDEIAAAEQRGYQRAIDALRDRERWAQWCAGRIVDDGWQGIDIRQPTDAADYLVSLTEGTQP